PLDVEGVLEAAAKSRCAVAVEDHMVDGGLGSALCELFSEHAPRPVLRIGYRGGFAAVGPAEAVRAHHGLTPEGIAGRTAAFLERELVEAPARGPRKRAAHVGGDLVSGRYLLVIDEGTTGTRASAVDERGQVAVW